MCNCDRTPDDDKDMDEISMVWYEQEREILDRAEAQRPLQWYEVAQNLCLPSLAYTAQTEPVR